MVFSLQDGVGAERGSTRLLYTYWKQKCILLDYVVAHDYHKAPAMNRGFMTSWFSRLKDQQVDIREVETIEPELDMENDSEQEQSISYIMPVGFDQRGDFIFPTQAQQTIFKTNYNTYPAIIEGPAGSGKTFVLSMFCEEFFQQQNDNTTDEANHNTTDEAVVSKKQKVVYLYPKNAKLLGEKMTQIWESSFLIGVDALPCSYHFEVKSIDECLPKALTTENLENIKIKVSEIFEMKKANLKKQITGAFTPQNKILWQAWSNVISSDIEPSLLTQYLISLAVFRAYLPGVSLKSLLSSRGGLSDVLFDAFEVIYEKISSSEWFTPVIQALHIQEEIPCDIVVLDEAQNTSFAALAYLVFHTKEHRVIYAGDRDQASAWDSFSPLYLIKILLQQRGLFNNHKELCENYRYPQEIWEYTQHRLIPLREQWFGREYQRPSSPIFSQITQWDALSYLRVCEKNSLLLQDFFAKIPEMSADCFVVASNPQDFDELSEKYLANKKLIVLTPDQIAGLEVKLVVALNPISFDLMRHIHRDQKVKSRLKKLTFEEELVYKQLNLFHVTLTRSTKSALILETKNNSHNSTHAAFFDGLFAPIVENQIDYAHSSKEELANIYQQIRENNPTAAEDFSKRYGHLFIDTFSNNNVPQENSGLIKKRKLSVLDTINMLNKRISCWDDLPEISAPVIAELLFTPYGGKKSNNIKTFFEKLVDHAQRISNTLTTEQNVWKKFLASKAYQDYVNDNFYELPFPGDKSSTIKTWLDQLPRTKWSDSIKNQLYSGKLEPIDPITSEKLPDRIEKPKPGSLPSVLNGSAQRLLQYEIDPHKKYSREERVDLLNKIGLQLMKAICQQNHLGISFDQITALAQQIIMICSKIEKTSATKLISGLLEIACPKDFYFWATLTGDKYKFLINLSANQRLFFPPGIFSMWYMPLLTQDNTAAHFDHNILKKAIDYVKLAWDRIPKRTNQPSQQEDFVYHSIKGMLEALAHYHTVIQTNVGADYKRLPLIVVLYKIDPDFCSLTNKEWIVDLLQNDDCWKNIDEDEKHIIFCLSITDVLMSNHWETHSFIQVMGQLALKFGIDYEKIWHQAVKKVEQNFWRILINSPAERIESMKHHIDTVYKNLQSDSRIHFDKKIKLELAYHENFWATLSTEKYTILQQLTDNHRLFWEEREEQNDHLNKRTLLCFEHSCLQDILRAAIPEKPEEKSWDKIIPGIIVVLSCYQKSLAKSGCSSQYLAPIVILIQRLCPAFINQIPPLVLLDLLKNDKYWDHAPYEHVFYMIKETSPTDNLLLALNFFIAEKELTPPIENSFENLFVKPMLLSQSQDIADLIKKAPGEHKL